ncbi:MAG: hypothetical protein AAF547_22510 [Actinomycetota bacterium]
MSYDPAKTGEAPIVWGGGPGNDPSTAGEPTRTLGFTPADIGSAAWVPDEPADLSAALLQDGRPFHGAYVPLVLHDPLLAERSVDAAEWAADLIRGEGGTLLCITPFAEKGWVADAPLSPRQWNHTAAMIERLHELCARFRLTAVVSDRIGDAPVQDDHQPDPSRPIHYVLDAGNFLPDGYVPARLVSPEKVLVDDGGPFGDRLRGLLKGKG